MSDLVGGAVTESASGYKGVWVGAVTTQFGREKVTPTSPNFIFAIVGTWDLLFSVMFNSL